MLQQMEITRELETVFQHPQAFVLSRVITNAYNDLVKTSDFNELKEIVRDIAVEQKKLAKAQNRTEGKVEELAVSQMELAEAQKRTETKVEELAVSQIELAEAQKRTETKVEELAEAQNRTEIKVEELAEGQKLLVKAQTRTERVVKQLAKQVGGLSDTIGGDVEDISYSVLPYVLEQELGWQTGPLERVWHTWGKQAEEVNIFGQVSDPTRPDETIWIVGEAKINLTFKEAGKFIKQLTRARQNLKGEIFPVCFCFRARPEVRQLLSEANVRLVFSYGKMV